jgi:hypothetical protein
LLIDHRNGEAGAKCGFLIFDLEYRKSIFECDTLPINAEPTTIVLVIASVGFSIVDLPALPRRLATGFTSIRGARTFEGLDQPVNCGRRVDTQSASFGWRDIFLVMCSGEDFRTDPGKVSISSGLGGTVSYIVSRWFRER